MSWSSVALTRIDGGIVDDEVCERSSGRTKHLPSLEGARFFASGRGAPNVGISQAGSVLSRRDTGGRALFVREVGPRFDSPVV